VFSRTFPLGEFLGRDWDRFQGPAAALRVEILESDSSATWPDILASLRQLGCAKRTTSVPSVACGIASACKRLKGKASIFLWSQK
jgi:hypothetical protein